MSFGKIQILPCLSRIQVFLHLGPCSQLKISGSTVMVPFRHSSIKYLYQAPGCKFSTGNAKLAGPSSWINYRILGNFKVPPFRQWISQKPQLIRLYKLAVGGGASVILAASGVYTYYSDWIREKNLAQAFDKGAVPEAKVANLIERRHIAKEIASILQPPPDYHRYDMIVGYQGVGKTTLVRHISHGLSGIVYVDVEEDATSNEDFGKAFAKAMNWSPRSAGWMRMFLEKLNIAQKEHHAPELLYKTVFDDFREQAEKFEKKNGRSPVLIFDNVNRLAANNSKLLASLQGRAKDAADNRRFIIIFVTSEGQAPLQMLGRSAKSRLGNVITVGDLTHGEVVELLCHKQNRNRQEVEKIYHLVAGRIGLIEAVVNRLDQKMDWGEIERFILLEAEGNFKNAKFLENGKDRKAAVDIIKHMIRCGRIHHREFLRIACSHQKEIEFLSYNIFATVPRSEWITFQSKPTEIIARELVTRVGTAGRFNWRWGIGWFWQ